ncbi:MAG: hypothetical protein ACOCY7_02865 [Halodesulfurarchaeum sp.]
MEMRKIIRLWVLVSIVSITGLTLFHRYVEDKTTTRSMKDALTEYGRATRWLVKQIVKMRRSPV